MLEEVAASATNEEQVALERKLQLRKEEAQYRQHLAAQRANQAAWESKVDELRQGEVEREWSRREAVWQHEAEARRRLLKNVLAVRREQVAARRVALEKAQAEAAEEAAKMAADIEASKAKEQAKAHAVHEFHYDYRRDLEQQITQKEARRREEVLREEEEVARVKRADERYRVQLERELAVFGVKA